jgi:hypothetical protein
MQICGFSNDDDFSWCSSSRQLPEERAFPHINNYKPYCSECFRESCCHAGPFELSPQCCCNESQKMCDVLVCRGCNGLPNWELRPKRDEKALKNLRATGRGNMKCARCAQPLPLKGPRWWRCALCDQECRSNVHSTWH